MILTFRELGLSNETKLYQFTRWITRQEYEAYVMFLA